MPDKAKKYLYLFLFVLTTIIWGLTFPVAKDLTNNGTPVYFLVACQFFLGAATLFSIRKLTTSPSIHFWEIKRGAALGAILFAAIAAQTWATTLTTPAKNAVLTSAYVFFAPVFLSFFSHKFPLRIILNGAVCLVGLFIFFEAYSDDATFAGGEWLALTCGALYASHFVLTEKIGGSINVMNLTQIQLTAVALMALAFTFIFDLPNLDFHKLIKSRIILEFLFLGVISIGFGYWTQFLAQTALSSATIAIVTCMESLFAAAFSVALGFEAFTLAMGVGGTVVLVSMIRATLEPIVPQNPRSKTNEANKN